MSNPLSGRFQIQYQPVTEPLVLPPAVVVPPLSWEPEYVDRPRVLAPLPVAILTAFFFAPVSPVAAEVVPLSWLGSQPDFPGRTVAPQPVSNLTGFAFVQIPPAAVPTLSWHPTYPDAVPGREPLVSPPFLSFNTQPIPNPVPILSWSPTYPGPVRTLPGLATANQQSIALASTPYVPTTDWIPEYPDFPGRRPIPLAVSLLTTYAHVGLTAYPAFTSFAAPFYFDAEAWPPEQAFYLEFYGRATIGTVFAGVAPESSGITIADSVVRTASASFQRLRSNAFRLSTGSYRLMLGKVAGDAGEAYSARILAVA